MLSDLFGPVISMAFLKKPKHVCVAEQVTDKLERTLSLFDLLCIGVGGTVGSGVFVLTGLIARDYAGPGVVISWIVAGVCCIFSAMSYAEMACRVPSAGSTYAYAYHALGELPAVVAAWCLTLEYGISGAAVARSWGDKLIILMESCCSMGAYLDPGFGVNVVAAVLQGATVCVLLAGVSVGKLTVNFFTVLKMAVVLFIIVAGLMLFEPANVSDWTPYGTTGVLRGTVRCRFLNVCSCNRVCM
jgi:amino acid transporter